MLLEAQNLRKMTHSMTGPEGILEHPIVGIQYRSVWLGYIHIVPPQPSHHTPIPPPLAIRGQPPIGTRPRSIIEERGFKGRRLDRHFMGNVLYQAGNWGPGRVYKYG